MADHKVVTVEGSKGRADLCEAHAQDSIVRSRHIGEWRGVYRGRHVGLCEECYGLGLGRVKP